MGHDVEIVGTNEVLYISGNFSCLNEKYGGIHQFHGHPGKIVAKIIKKTIQKANADGFFASKYDEANIDWGWGVKNGKLMDNQEFIGVFLYHMNNFLKAAEEYPENVFKSDQVFEVVPYEEN